MLTNGCKCLILSNHTLCMLSYNKKEPPVHRKALPLLCIILRLYVYDFPFIVRTAALAYSVGYHQCAAFAAFYQSRSRHFPVCSSLISPCTGRFILGTNRHTLHLLIRVKDILYRRHPGVRNEGIASTFSQVQILSAYPANSFAVRSA